MTSLTYPPRQSTPYVYLSKVVTEQDCPMKYLFQHHYWLQTKGRQQPLVFGSAFHKVVEIGHMYGFHVSETILTDNHQLLNTFLKPPQLKEVITLVDKSEIRDLAPADKDLGLKMLDAFVDKWNAIGVKRVLSTEYSVQMPLEELGLSSPYFTHWVCKADCIFEDNEGLWVGDWKTTASYGASTAKYYHTAPQTKTYFHVLKKRMPKLRGTKIFVVTKKAIRCEVEPILLTSEDHFEAQTFMEEAIVSLNETQAIIESGQQPKRRMCSCVQALTGRECPYIPICLKQIKSQAYLDDALSYWYDIGNPDAHLELGE